MSDLPPDEEGPVAFDYAEIAEAIRQNNTNTLVRFLKAAKQQAALLPADDQGETVLHLAASEPQYELCLALLLHHGDGILDLDAASEEGKTALFVACQKGSDVSVLLLLQAGCNPNVSTFGHWPLHIAALEGHTTIVEYLLSFGADIDKRNASKMVPLHLASYQGHMEICSMLLENGANMALADEFGRIPLHVILMVEDLEDTLFVWNHVDFGLLNYPDNIGLTPFMSAVGFMNAQGARYLLENGGRMDMYDNSGRTPLHFAINCENFETFQLLLQSMNLNDYKSSFPFTGSPNSREIFDSLTNNTIDDPHSLERLKVLLSSGLPKSILQMPSVERNRRTGLYVSSPGARLLSSWMYLDESEEVELSQLMAKHNILILDEFKREFQVKWPENVAFNHPLTSHLYAITKKFKRFLNVLNTYGVTTDYCLQGYHDTAQPFATFSAYDRYYDVVIEAAQEGYLGTVKWLVSDSVILEPDKLLVCTTMVNSVEKREGSDDIYQYLTSLKPIYYMREQVQRQCRFNYWPLLEHVDTEEFSRVTLLQLGRTAVRDQLREPSLEGNLLNFRRKILELRVPNSLKDYLLFKC